MLVRLDIRDFTIVDALTVEFAGGFTTITGETGAGKSIMLDALALVLGDRASPEFVRPGADGADLVAEFDVGAIPEARAWLAEQALEDPDAPATCLLRRTVGADGRSRAFVNGRPSTLQTVRELADHLIDLHSQHEHTSLLRRGVQRRLLDEYGGHDDVLGAVAAAHGRWQALAEEFAALKAAADEQADRRQLLGYQLEELDAVAPAEGELDELEAGQRRLAGAEEALRRVEGARTALEDDDDAVADRLGRLLSTLDAVDDPHPAIAAAREMLESARVNVDEAATELRRYAEGLEPDPERLQALEDRLGVLHDLARKHRVRPEGLPELHERLRTDLDALGGDAARLEALGPELETARTDLGAAADALTKARGRAGKRLAKAVTAQLASLGMKDARLEVRLAPHDDDHVGPEGREAVELLVTANAGMAPGPLGRVASGGELSRISLAIQVVTAETSRIPSLVLDEADVGIGGSTAEVVGRLLRRLGEHTQILAVTHLPQVAALGHAHLAVEKQAGRGKQPGRTRIVTLDADARVAELARMLGGVEITEQTRAHASEMLARAADAA